MERREMEHQFPWGDPPRIKIYDSLTRKEEVFPSPGEHPLVTIYVCGPTTYQFVHVGNMRNPVFFDVVRKIFRAFGYRVLFVTNFTDLDDKIIDEAKKAGEADPIQWSARFVHEYYTDLFALGVEKADVYPKVTTHIKEIIEYVQKIMDNGHAYVGKDNSVYFDVPSFPDYLKLSGRNMDDLLDESRQEEVESSNKKDSRDFALWKIAKEGEPAWDSPWGPGRPGWHIECSVMSAKYLGKTFDIHGGGQELRFPHHENEIAQAKCGDPDEDFARIWMHNEWVMMDGAKMAKSGKSVKIRDVLKEVDPEVVRLFLLSAHYRKPMDFTWDKFDEYKKALDRLKEVFDRLTGFLRWRAEERVENWFQIWSHIDEKNDYDRGEFIKMMAEKAPDPLDGEKGAKGIVNDVRRAMYYAYWQFANDFNTQGVVGELFGLVTKVNAHLDVMSSDNTDDFDAANIALGGIAHLTEILGILNDRREKLYLTDEARDEALKGGGDASKLADVLLALREKARAEKNFELADKIRDELNEIGAEVRDSKDGAKIVWK
jgi:cysteinyl-tRNA synthetase